MDVAILTGPKSRRMSGWSQVMRRTSPAPWDEDDEGPRPLPSGKLTVHKLTVG